MSRTRGLAPRLPRNNSTPHLISAPPFYAAPGEAIVILIGNQKHHDEHQIHHNGAPLLVSPQIELACRRPQPGAFVWEPRWARRRPDTIGPDSSSLPSQLKRCSDRGPSSTNRFRGYSVTRHRHKWRSGYQDAAHLERTCQYFMSAVEAEQHHLRLGRPRTVTLKSVVVAKADAPQVLAYAECGFRISRVETIPALSLGREDSGEISPERFARSFTRTCRSGPPDPLRALCGNGPPIGRYRGSHGRQSSHTPDSNLAKCSERGRPGAGESSLRRLVQRRKRYSRLPIRKLDEQTWTGVNCRPIERLHNILGVQLSFQTPEYKTHRLRTGTKEHARPFHLVS